MENQNFLTFLQNSISQLTEEKTKLQYTYEHTLEQNNIIYDEQIKKLNEENKKLNEENKKLNEENKKLNEENKKLNNRRRPCFALQNKGYCNSQNCCYDHYCKYNSRCNNNYCKLIHVSLKRDFSPKRSYNSRHRTPIHSRESSPIRHNRRNYNNVSREYSPVRHSRRNYNNVSREYSPPRSKTKEITLSRNK